MQWREIAPPVEILRLSWFYWPRLSTTPTIVRHKIMRAPLICLVASATTETVYNFHVFAGTGSSGPPPCHVIFGPPMQTLKTNPAIQTLETNPANHSYPEPSP